MPLLDIPSDVTIVSQLIEKTLKNGMLVEVYLVKTSRQYEAALFIEGHFKSGPPIPRPTDTPTDAASYWMGVRPKVGLSKDEGDEILGAINVQNRLHHCFFKDTWGMSES